jgi:cell division inhibitor SepF
MPGFLKKAQVYLGLGPDDEYDDYEEYDDRPVAPAREPREMATARSGGARPSPASTATATRPAPARAAREPAPRPRPAAPPAPPEPATEVSAVRPLPPKDRPIEPVPSAPKVQPKPVVRQVPSTSKPTVVSPTSFASAQEVADKFKASQPVILNLQGVEKDLARRLLDFCSGICYSLSGHMEKVAARVYLLTPENVEVSAEERRRLQERGLDA